MKRLKALMLILLIGLFVYLPINIYAYTLSKDDKIYVSGEAIGIKLNCGIEVVGTFGLEVDGIIYKPWYKAGIEEGDIITSLNNIAVHTKTDILNVLTQVKDNEVAITYIRGEKELESIIQAVASSDGYSLGLYIRDSILGVGTLTYYIEDANIYGSLGHKITNSDYYNGEIFEASVTGIKMPTRSEAGEKKASITGRSIGSVSKNTNTGVHGIANSNIDTSNMKLLPFKTREEIKLGDAEIWTCINGTLVEKFDIKITSLEHQNKKDIKGISFKVTDKELLSKTGGIIQGMSGSPIIQDGAIIGAVTHVSLNNSANAYGIYIEWMFEDMGVLIEN